MISTPPQIPSYTQGFARQRGDSADPEPWERLVGLWAPLLGPTGTTLLNWSPYGQALGGTLTNMDPGADWVASAHGWTLSFPGSTDYVVVPHAEALIPPRISVRVLFKTPVSLSATSSVVISKGDGAATRVDYDLYYNSSGDLHVRFYDGGWRAHLLASVISVNTWYDAVFSFGDGRARISIDGRLELDEVEANAMPQSGGNLYLGNYSLNQTFSFGGQIALVQIWDRVLTGSEVERLHADPLALPRLRHRVLRILPAVGGTYHVAAGQMFHTGSEGGEAFSAGTIIGECDGRSG